MTAAEQALVKQIVAGYLGTWPEASRAKIMTAFNDTDPSDVRFAWSGPDVREAPHYWRIVSPVLVVEYWNGRAGANHAHAVVRTRHGEFPNG